VEVFTIAVRHDDARNSCAMRRGNVVRTIADHHAITSGNVERLDDAKNMTGIWL